jgi:DNA-binding response OmpR family regulator
MGPVGEEAIKILIAEDDEISRFFLEKTLEKLGYSVTACKDGNEAWKAYMESDYIMVISDWMMPETDGIELLRRIRRQHRGSYCYFMMLTAKTSKTDFLVAMSAGADDYLTKPLDPQEIEVRLRMAERSLLSKSGSRTGTRA